jgi:hypothetical protein
MRSTLVALAVALLLALALPASARDVNLAGGLTLAGDRLSYDVQATYPLIVQPAFNLKLLWAPEQGQAAGAISTPVATGTDPLFNWLKWTPAPWVSDLTHRVEVGLAGWRTEDRFLHGGLYWEVTALSWGF